MAASEPSPRDEPVAIAPANDPRLAAAAARARNRIGEFIQKLRERPPGVRFAVKAAFRRLDRQGLKHMWVDVSALDADSFIGTLDNDSDGKTVESRGDTVRVPIDEIEDWIYDRGGKKCVGGFSLPVLEGIEREQRKQQRE